MTSVFLKLDISDIQETFEALCSLPFLDHECQREKGIESLIKQLSKHIKEEEG